jgi:hypothetical protein
MEKYVDMKGVALDMYYRHTRFKIVLNYRVGLPTKIIAAKTRHLEVYVWHCITIFTE